MSVSVCAVSSVQSAAASAAVVPLQHIPAWVHARSGLRAECPCLRTAFLHIMVNSVRSVWSCLLARYLRLSSISVQAASAYDAAARKIRGNSTKFNLQERDFSDAVLQTAANSALEQLEKSRTERNVWPDTAAAASPDEGRHAKLLQELLAENNGNVRPVVITCLAACRVAQSIVSSQAWRGAASSTKHSTC